MDFFISYSKADLAWAEWIAWQLEVAGYRTVIQAWDFRPGANFVLEMDRASQQAKRTIAVLSPSYLEAAYTHPEWAGAFARDPQGDKKLLLPVRVRDCELSGLLAAIVYIDLVGLGEEDAKDRLLAEISSARRKPKRPPLFPGANSLPKPAFPAAASEPTATASAPPLEPQVSSAAMLRKPAPGPPDDLPGLSPAVLRTVEQELAKHIGPIAPRLVRKAANQVATAEDLYALLASKIRDNDERAEFLHRVTDAPNKPPPDLAGKLDPSLVAVARKELTKYLGPIAKRKVDRAVQVATTPEDFYQSLASHLRDDTERTAFLKRVLPG